MEHQYLNLRGLLPYKVLLLLAFGAFLTACGGSGGSNSGGGGSSSGAGVSPFAGTYSGVQEIFLVFPDFSFVTAVVDISLTVNAGGSVITVDSGTAGVLSSSSAPIISDGYNISADARYFFNDGSTCSGNIGITGRVLVGSTIGSIAGAVVCDFGTTAVAAGNYVLPKAG